MAGLCQLLRIAGELIVHLPITHNLEHKGVLLTLLSER